MPKTSALDHSAKLPLSLPHSTVKQEYINDVDEQMNGDREHDIIIAQNTSILLYVQECWKMGPSFFNIPSGRLFFTLKRNMKR